VIPAARFRELERSNIVAALERCAWRVAGEHGAARLLGMKPSTLAYQMKALGIERSDHRNP
jgi:transcriptional regulator with GAF, ATPase, and Fis domain